MTLEVNSLCAGYGDTPVLRRVDLTVRPTSAVALIGANGAGKSTLLKAISGLLPHSSGSVELDGIELPQRRPDEVAERGVCLIPEGRGIFASLSVRENLILQNRPGNEAEGIERSVAAFPWIGDRLAQQAGTLSGGQQQMLALCRAYGCNASYVLVDEVSMGLSPVLVDQIYEFLAELRTAGAALLIVEQFIDRALGLADEVYAMQKGCCTALGRPQDLDHDQLLATYLGQAATT